MGKKRSFNQLLIALLLIVAGCGSDHGPDNLYTRPSPSAGAPITSCTQCHTSARSPLLDPLVTNGSGTYGKHVRHVQVRGIACERCHNGYFPTSTHMNGVFDTGNPALPIVSFDSINPSGAWSYTPAPRSGICASLYCHNNEPLDWYGTNVWSLPPCDICHSTAIGLRRIVTGAGGDFGANMGMLSHHVTATSDPTPAQCQVCHEMTQHMGGGVRLKHADTGAAIAYDPADLRTLEPFCLSCHDATGAGATFASGGTPTNPFNDGSELGSAPYPFALRIASSWTGTHGHGPNGDHAAAARLSCIGSGQPGTGCHGNGGTVNAHGSVNRVLAARTFNYDNSSSYAEADFALCFDCHASYLGVTKEDVLGVKQNGILDGDYGFFSGGNGPDGWNPPYYTFGVTTRFRDHNDAGGAYNDFGTWWGPNANLHWAHLGYPSSYRAGAVVTCISCHDVHGSSNPFGATYHELGYVHSDCTLYPGAGSGICTSFGPEQIGRMADSAYDTNQLNAYPAFCAFNCHSIQGSTKAWYDPLLE